MKAFFAKRSSALGIGLAALFFLVGCPVYPDNSYSYATGSRCPCATDCPIGSRCSAGYCSLAPPFGGAAGGTDAGTTRDAALDAGDENAVESDVGTDAATESTADTGDAARAPDGSDSSTD